MKKETRGKFHIITLDSRSEWQSALEEAVSAPKGIHVLFDIGKLEKMEFGQITSFVNLSTYAVEHGKEVTLVNPTDETLQVIKALHLGDDVISVFASANLAMIVFGGGPR